MITIATLQTSAEDQQHDLPTLTASLKKEEIDILCCRESMVAEDAGPSVLPELAASLEMSYTLTQVRSPLASSVRGGKTTKSNLAILTRNSSWMLNSGSLPLLSCSRSRRLQFGVIRNNGNSILVLNALFGGQGKSALNPLEEMIRLPLLKEQFGAMVLFSDLESAGGAQGMRAAFAQSHLKMEQGDGRGEGCLPTVLTSRDQPLAAVTLEAARSLDSSAPAERQGQPDQLGGIIELQFKRLAKGKRKKRILPLSFRERWLGSREGRIFAY
ncbi:hypothetical protein [Desulfogranum mediterraneum]|uniref:hypothetical protein n=1 Tax=Desulfogranum mediterraneum TaxID=160661 RepID=UPI0013775231|nr:hypothetical protein [Desulfogranum mediterraneum]